MKQHFTKGILSLFLLLCILPPLSATNEVVVSFSAQGGFYDDSFDLILSCPEAYTIHYTLNGKTPTASDPVYSVPLTLDKSLFSQSNFYKIQSCPDEQWFIPDDIQKCIVVRAAAFDSGGQPCSPVSTNSYFIRSIGNYPSSIPVVSLCADSSALFDHTIGIMTSGASHNHLQRGKDWERPCNIEFYETDNSGINQQAGVRMHGGGARNGIQKGMKLYARKEYGQKQFCHKFFETTENRCFRHLVLKPLKEGSVFRDYLCDRMAYSVDVETVASRPVTLFLNGEFWGIYFLKEKPDAQFVSDHFGYEKEDINVIESWYGGISDGDNTNFVEMMRWLMQADLSDSEDYDKMCRLIDVDCFIDYYCLCLFIGIPDWPDRNMRCWQAGDGKWRWIFFDGDYGCGPTQNMFYYALYNGENAMGPVLMFSKLLSNADFRDRFYDRYGKLLTNEFGYGNTSKTFATCMAFINDESELVGSHFARFGWPNQMEDITSFSDTFLKNRIVNASGMIYSLYYCNNWSFRRSAKTSGQQFKYNPKSKRPTFLLRMYRQFDDFEYVKAYLSHEPRYIREKLKSTKTYKYFKAKRKNHQ